MKHLMFISLFSAAGLAIAESQPFKGKVHVIPGTIEAEHYDEGKAGVAYVDLDPQNQGADYREPTQVDIEKRPDASNGHGIGWTRKGEWLNYTVEVKKSGIYSIEMPVASKKWEGFLCWRLRVKRFVSLSVFRIQVDGINLNSSSVRT